MARFKVGAQFGPQHCTMDELRASAESGVSGLEEIFLRLTGEGLARELVEVLDA